MLTCLGPDALKIVDRLRFASEEDHKDIDVVLGKLEWFCVGEINKKSVKQSRGQPVKPSKQRKIKQQVHVMSQYSSSKK